MNIGFLVGYFFKGLFSVGENRISTLVCTFMVFCGFVIYMFMKTQTIDSNMLTLLCTFIYSIAGINGVNTIGEIITMKNQLSQLDNKTEQIQEENIQN